MSSKCNEWAVIERHYLRQDIKELKEGSKVLSSSGEDITAKKLGELEARLEHANLIVNEADNAHGT